MIVALVSYLILIIWSRRFILWVWRTVCGLDSGDYSLVQVNKKSNWNYVGYSH